MKRNTAQRGVTLTIERIGPADAQRMLDNAHPRQRTLMPNRVAHYALMMQAGDWFEPPYTYSVIAIDDHGRVVNGQHRLRAVIESGRTVEFWIMRGVRSIARFNLPEGDAGVARTTSFLLDVNDRSWQVIEALTDMRMINYAMDIFQKRQLLPALEKSFEAIPYLRKPTFGAAPFRAAFCWRYANPTFLTPSEVAEQYQAFMAADFNSMNRALGALWKHVTTGKLRATGGNSRRELFAKTMYALDTPNASRACGDVRGVLAEYISELAAVTDLLGISVQS